MLLTLVTRSLASQFVETDNGRNPLAMLEMPEYTIQQLQLRGLNVPASMLAGWSLEDLDRLRDRADKAGCPCLVLIEDAPLAIADPSDGIREVAANRVQRLAAAAHRLGCNAVAVTVEAKATTEAFDLAADELKAVMQHVERLELNLLLSPGPGLVEDPERLTDLIKRIGGFRIGSLPSFGHAAQTGDLVGTLRKLAPYAGAIHATVDGFKKTGAHKGYDLAECVRAIRSVGFVNTLAIDYQGEGDAAAEISQAREALEAAIESD